MLISQIAKRSLKPCTLGSLGIGLTRSHSYPYIRKKELQDIEKEYGSSTSDKLKMYSKQAKLIYAQGWSALKKDIVTYRSMKQKQKQGTSTLTDDEARLKKRMWQQIAGLKTLVVIQILPFSGPLLLYYIYVYPTSIPSWFSVDSLHENYQLECIQKQAQAVKHFKEYPINISQLRLNHLKNQELKKLSELLFGHYEDGLTGYNKLMAPKTKEYFFHPTVSKHLLIRNMKRQFDKQIYNNPQLKSKSIEELVVQKYNRIMGGEESIIFEPVHEVYEEVPVSPPESVKNHKTKNR